MLNIKQYINEKLILSKQKIKYPEEEYFYHEALEDGYTTKFINTENLLQYSIDNCNTWQNLKKYTETPTINKGQRIYFKGENLKSNYNDGIGVFTSNKQFNVGGNIMSLIYEDNFEDKTKLLEDALFISLFYENEYLVSAKDLVLPATKLTNECYRGMFYACKSLKEAPELPATKLADNCYNNMFVGCTSLIKAPELHAAELINGCYNWMFGGCKSLNEITMLATDISMKYLHGWVINVSKTGTFIKAKGVDIPTGNDGIPEGWAIKEI